MAEVTITIKDTPKGGTRVTAEFNPPKKQGDSLTNAQWSAVYMIKALDERLKRERVDTDIEVELEN